MEYISQIKPNKLWYAQQIVDPIDILVSGNIQTQKITLVMVLLNEILKLANKL